MAAYTKQKKGKKKMKAVYLKKENIQRSLGSISLAVELL
jgi:hypothetical protein